MHPRGFFSNEIWLELMWSFLWILLIPIAVTLILLTLTVLGEVISRVVNEPRNNDNVSTFR